MLDLSHYTPGHRQDLSQLLAFNEGKARAAIAQGCEDRALLLRNLSQWPEALDGHDPVISFLGLNVTADCNYRPRCLYCNQPWIEPLVDGEGWKRIVEEVTTPAGGPGPYVYITGGEPLLLGEGLWGDEGLVRCATERGAGVNVNTNGALLSPEVSLRLIKAGLGKLHISLDTADQEVQDDLRGGEGFAQVVEAIYNVQLARDLVGVSYPVIHTNCVLTRRNLELFPQLLALILEKHKQTGQREDPLFNDLFPHVIPVGGKSNDHLRPSDGEFKRFYEEVWPAACRLWDAYQDRVAVPGEKRRPLFGYFSNPFLRVEHRGGLEAYVRASAEGRYGRLALPRYCYVAPTQASFRPDGSQYRCGSHSIRGILPIGNVRERAVFASIRAGVEGLEQLPDEEQCYGCALATLYINQAVEAKLKEKVESLLLASRPATEGGLRKA
jgi:MoaA/NifB/PqqE/SkfB family radical SAM enzyme